MIFYIVWKLKSAIVQYFNILNKETICANDSTTTALTEAYQKEYRVR